MKTRLKHLSKSTISILLALMMLVTTVTVGIVATNAAYVNTDESVGWSSFQISTNSDNTSEKLYPDAQVSVGETVIIDANYWLTNSDHNMPFKVKANDTYMGGSNITFYDGDTKNLSSSSDYAKVYVTKRYVFFTVTHNSDTSVSVKVELSNTDGTTYTVAGSSTALFGSSWDQTDENNDMEWTDESVNYDFVWEKSNVALTAGNIEFKIVKKHDWEEGSWPTNNKVEAIAADGHYDVKITFNSDTEDVGIAVSVTEFTVSAALATGVTNAMGSVSVSDDAVAYNGTPTFTATPETGYEFAGWYSDASASAETFVSGLAEYTPTITEDTTLYAKFQTPFTGYYLGGRFAVATSAENIYANTTGGSVTQEEYGNGGYTTQTRDDAYGLYKSTAGTDVETGKINYWRFSAWSTNLKFTPTNGTSDSDATQFKLETHRTIRQLSESKSTLTDHDPFYFFVHDTENAFGGSAKNGQNFENQLGTTDANKLTISKQALADPMELLFTNFDNESDGQVVIYLDTSEYNRFTGAGSMKIWYMLEDTTTAVGSVDLTATPDPVQMGNRVTLTASVTNAAVNTDQLTYTFYRATQFKQYTDNNVTKDSDIKNWIPLTSLDEDYEVVINGATATLIEPISHAPVYYKVVVTTAQTYTKPTSQANHKYSDRSAEDSVVVTPQQLSIAETVNEANPASAVFANVINTYVADDANPYVITLADADVERVFAISNTGAWDDKLEDYKVRTDLCQCATVTLSHVDIGNDDDGYIAPTIYKAKVNPNCEKMKIYIDFRHDKHEIWAIAEFSGATKENYIDAQGALINQGTVTYYFAERVGAEAKSDPSTAEGDNHDGMRIEYWNNSYPSVLKGTADVTSAFVPHGKSGNTIYVDTSALFHDNTGSLSGFQSFKVYKVDLPVWATSFKFVDKEGNDFDAVPTKSATLWQSNHSDTLNPDRIYCLFNSNSTASDDSNWRVKGVVLDESMWDDNRANANEVSLFKVDTNIINYTDNERLQSPIKPNRALSTLYSSQQTPNALYFGFMATTSHSSGMSDITYDYASWADADEFYGFDGDTEEDWVRNLAQRKDDNAYFASIQGLVGDVLSDTLYNQNGDGNTFGYLQDSNATIIDPDTGKATKTPHPVFDYTNLATAAYDSATDSEDHPATSLIKEGSKFPFYVSKMNGITTYSFDSTTDRNRLYNSTSGELEVQATTTNKGFATGIDTEGAITGLFPFGGNDNSYSNCGFGLEFDLNFYMTNTGTLTDANGDAQDITFNFSGDDDVWVFIDGVKVLDLGGEHKVSAATINLTEGKVYYKSSANSITNAKSIKGAWATGDKNYINVVDFREIMAAYGKPFDPTKASVKHTFQMFYLERGAFQSNCVISFNLPQATGLNIVNKVQATNVNQALQEMALYSANPDYFTYTVKSKLVNGTLPANITNKGGRTPTTSVQSGDLTLDTPKYPYNYDTSRVYPAIDGDHPAVTYKLSKAGDPGSGSSTITYTNSGWSNVGNTVYSLTDDYLEAVRGQDQLTGKTDANGVLHMLGSEKATFDNKIPLNSYVQVIQKQDLGKAKLVSANADPITYQTVTNNETGNYYYTTYSVFDEKSKKYIVRKGTEFDLTYKTGTTNFNDYDAKDADTSGNGFYFSNYSDDAEDPNAAMTVEFVNEIAVGTIRISKAIEGNAPSKSTFRFTVKFKRVFGHDHGANDDFHEYDGLKYTVYNSDGTKYGDGTYTSRTGIALKAGQYAEIEGVPVETVYQIEERTPETGYSFSKLTRSTYKSDGTTAITTSDGTTSYQYAEVINAPAAAKTSDTVLWTEQQQGEEDFDYYINMIPPVSEAYVGPLHAQNISISKADFINSKVKFYVHFKYYDRNTSEAAQGKPVAISTSPSDFKVEIDDMDRYVIHKGQDDEKFQTLPRYAGLANDDYVCVDFEQIVTDASLSFAMDSGGGVSNLIDEYTMQPTQAKMNAKIKTTKNLHDTNGGNYTGDNTKYHTDPDGKYNTQGELWVNYYTQSDAAKDPENPTNEAFYAGDTENYSSIKYITVWLFNQPKQYHVNVYGATTADKLNAEKTVTLHDYSSNSDNKLTLNNIRVAKKSNNTDSYSFDAYYSQRLGDKKGNEYLDDIAYLKAYGVDSCVDIGTEGNVERVLPESKAPKSLVDSTANKTYVFAYWAYDDEGTQVASTEWRFGNRVTGAFDLYAVYAPSETAQMLSNYKNDRVGLTILEDADDAFIKKDTSDKDKGIPYIRINTMFNPYNIDDYNKETTNINNLAMINIYVSNLINDGFSDEEIKALHAKYSDQLLAYLNASNFLKLQIDKGTKLIDGDSTHAASVNLQLTTRGYVYVTDNHDGAVELTNKNRLEFTTQFKKSSLYKADEKIGILQIGAMKYKGSWILSDNSILRTFDGRPTPVVPEP